MKRIFLSIFVATLFVAAHAVEVKLTAVPGTKASSAMQTASANLALLLTEVNRAQKAQSILELAHIPMTLEAKTDIADMWAMIPFYCDDDVVVEPCWTFENGTMMVRNIPFIMTPTDPADAAGVGTYQAAVVEFDRRGQITDVRLSVDGDNQSMSDCGDVVDTETRLIVMQYVERLRTAYNRHDIKFIEQAFSDKAIIITGRVVQEKQLGDNDVYATKVKLNKQSKQEYINKLKLTFARNKWIDVQFTEWDESSLGGCGSITRSSVMPTRYGIRLKQSWRSTHYSDEGYLFLLWDIPENGDKPQIYVRTWQPSVSNGKSVDPDISITTLAGFDL